MRIYNGIESSSHVKEEVRRTHGVNTKLTVVKSVFRSHFGLKYKRIKRTPGLANSSKNLVLRQKFGTKMLELLTEGKRILNVDETWVPQTKYLKRQWRLPGSAGSLWSKAVAPRITMIAAIDTEGEVYFSMNQCNTDTPMMRLFISKLAMELDAIRPGWRNDTVLLLDGATYHKSKELQDHFYRLKMDVLYTAPYSYDASPVELFFAHFKDGNLNPDRLPTGKK